MTPVERPTTIPELLAATVARQGDQPALGTTAGGELAWRTWDQLDGQARRQAAALQALGIEPGDRVAQFAPNSRAWILADLACQLAGAVHVPLHATISAVQAAQQTAHAEARILLVASEEQGPQVRQHVDPGVQVFTHAELAEKAEHVASAGRVLDPPRSRPDDLATILYTSGTTGEPLGVMLTHRNIVSNTRAVCEQLAAQAEDLRVGILPLSHIYARTCDLYVWIYRGSRFVLAESRETLLRDCQLVRPTVLNFVPYIYQRIADGLRQALPDAGAEALAGMFGGKIRRLYCGGAALAPDDVEQYFADRGLPIMCGYGLSEASPVITMTSPGQVEPTTVGRPLANLEVKLADDGEVMARGDSIMPGYWKNPEATARVLRDGWLLTGDLGEWTPAGSLRIIGRKKELLVLATGKKATPTRIEQLLCSSPLIEQACVVGDGRKFLGALIVPSGAAPRDALAQSIRAEIDRTLADQAECEQIGAFVILDRPFSIDAGELTPKFSLRRGVIEQRYAAQIEAMYAPL